MNTFCAVINLALGVAYCGYGVMTLIEMERDWDTFGFSHFGLAWVFMAFTCGPHHLVHGVHILAEGRRTGALDLFSVLVGLPVGVLWLALRVEAFRGGRGDRFINGTPSWLRAGPALAGVYVIGLAAASGRVMGTRPLHLTLFATANAALVVVYVAIGWFLLRTQLRNREAMGGWSVSGLSLSVVFPTCALMHAVWMVYAVSGVYAFDIHGFVIDWLSIPAGLYFLWVVRGLYRDALQDWNCINAEPVSVATVPAPWE